MHTHEFTLKHPNGRGNGCAIHFSVVPASFSWDGAVRFTVARQNADADFDWPGGTEVTLSPLEAAEMLLVFGGQVPSLVHAGKDGLFHDTPLATVSVSLKRSEDYTRPGFLLGVGRTPKADPTARTYHTFAFSPAEAYLLRAAIKAKMGELVFGA